MVVLSPLLCLVFVLVSANHPMNAAPSPALILSCGDSEGGKDDDGRMWTADAKYLASGDKSVTAKADTQDPSLPSTIPYMTARIFQSQGTYQFPLKWKRNSPETPRALLRLTFYPSSYSSFNISDSYFSVIAGGVTLLNNFSTSLSAEALSQAYFIKEYYISTDKEATILNVAFKPSDKHSSSFAFVNGIEVVYAPPIFGKDPVLVGTYGSDVDSGQMSTVPIETNSLEAVYRLNVGGRYIAPANDSGGLMRSWYDDSVYLQGGYIGVTVESNTTIRYNGMPSFIAPLDVYSTYRSMGPYKDVNIGSNMTWIFEVDSGFTYLIRFHWCEFLMTKSNQRVFDVYINNKTAAQEVDIYTMTGIFATPVTKDYAIRVKNKTNDPQISIALHPTNATTPEYLNILLNGLEIFKISDTVTSNLAGPNPKPSDMMMKYKEAQMAPNAFEDERNGSINTTVVITSMAGGAAVIGLGVAFIIVVYKKKRSVAGREGNGADRFQKLLKPYSYPYSFYGYRYE